MSDDLLKLYSKEIELQFQYQMAYAISGKAEYEFCQFYIFPEHLDWLTLGKCFQ